MQTLFCDNWPLYISILSKNIYFFIIPLDNYKVLVYFNVKYVLLLFLIFMENQGIVQFLYPGKVVEI